jgi:hypothetical protein
MGVLSSYGSVWGNHFLNWMEQEAVFNEVAHLLPLMNVTGFGRGELSAQTNHWALALWANTCGRLDWKLERLSAGEANMWKAKALHVLRFWKGRVVLELRHVSSTPNV